MRIIERNPILWCIMLLCAALLTGVCSLHATAKGEEALTEFAKKALAITDVDVDKLSENERLRQSDLRFADVADEVAEYLAKKYPGATLTLENCIRRDIDNPYDEFQFSAPGVEELIVVQALDTDEGITCKDDYYGYLNAESYERWQEELFRDLEPDIRVFSTIHCKLGEKYDANYPIVEAADDAVFFAYTWLLLPPAQTPFADRVAALRTRIDEKGLSADFKVYAMLKPLPREAEKVHVFALIPSHCESAPVYSAMERFAHRGVE